MQTGGKIKSKSENNKKINYSSPPFILEGSKELNNRIHKISQSLSETVIKPAYKTSKLRDFFQNKDKIASGLKSNIVYNYACDRCSMRYIGATTRHFNTRISEHLRGYPTHTEVSMHEHAPKQDNFSFLGYYKFPFILESILIANNSVSDCLANERNGSFPLSLRL